MLWDAIQSFIASKRYAFLKLIGWGVLSTSLCYLSFPTHYGHLLFGGFICFVPMIYIGRQCTSFWKTCLKIWTLLQIFLFSLFYFNAPQMPTDSQFSTRLWAVWLIIIVPTIIYAILISGSIKLFKPTLLGSAASASLLVIGEYLFLELGCKFPLTAAITVFDQPVILQLAALGGWGCISWLVWVSNFWISGWIKKPSLQPSFIAVGILLIVTSFGYWRLNQLESQITQNWSTTLGLIQPNLTWEEQNTGTASGFLSKKPFSEIDQLLDSAIKLNPHIIVFPEGLTSEQLSPDKIFKHLINKTRKTEIPLLVSCKVLTPKNVTASAAIYIQNGKLRNLRTKEKTIPFVEDKPDNLNRQNVFFDVYQGFRVGSLICFEALYSSIALKMVNEGANLLICHANTSYFGQSNWAPLHAAYVPIRAAESGRHVVLVNETGFSIAASPSSRIIMHTDFRTRAVYKLKVTCFEASTFYSRHPNFFWILCGSFLVVCGLIKIIVKRDWL